MKNQPNKNPCGADGNPHASLGRASILPKYGFCIDCVVCFKEKEEKWKSKLGVSNFEPYLTEAQLTEWEKEMIDRAQKNHDVQNVFIVILNVTAFLRD
jgi:hypothetical protein